MRAISITSDTTWFFNYFSIWWRTNDQTIRLFNSENILLCVRHYSISIYLMQIVRHEMLLRVPLGEKSWERRIVRRYWRLLKKLIIRWKLGNLCLSRTHCINTIDSWYVIDHRANSRTIVSNGQTCSPKILIRDKNVLRHHPFSKHQLRPYSFRKIIL